MAVGVHSSISAFYTPTGNSVGSAGSLSFTVNPAPLTITASSKSKPYGQTATFSATAFTETGLVNGDTITGVTETSTGAAVSATVGTYSIVPFAAAGTDLADYTITYVDGTLTVNPAALTITANSASKTYGQTATFSTTTFTETGLVTSQRRHPYGVSETSTGAPVSATVGAYNIVPSAVTGTGISNYTIIYVNGTLTVNPAALTITANSASKTYGVLETFNATAFTETGLVTANGDTTKGVTETSTGAPVSATVGSYNIVPSAAAGSGLANYTITYVNGTLTVNPASLTIAANNDSKIYGTLKTFAATAFTEVGLVTANGDTITGVTETSSGAPVSATVGTYAIVPSTATGTGLANYIITYDMGTLTVNPAPLSITATDSKTYGTLKVFSGTVFTETGLVTANGDTITGVTETSTGAPVSATVGTYPIVISAATGTGLSNYIITYVNGTLTVNPASLTVTANSTSKIYGTPEIFFPWEFTEVGLVTQNGDFIAGVTENSTGAPVSATVGTYPIVPSSAIGNRLNNYVITYISGTLTVNPAPLIIVADNESKPFGTVATFSPTAFTEFGLVTWNGDTITGVTETSTGAPASAPVGSYPIVASAATGNRLNNYTICYVNGTLTVNLSIIILDPKAGGALSLSGNSTIALAGGVFVDSSSSSALSAGGNATVEASVIDVAGGVQKSGNVSFSPAPVTRAATLADPLSGLGQSLPSTSGLTNFGSESLSGNSSATIRPGIYSQISVSGNAKLTLTSGLYIIEGGGFSVSGNASVTGSAVTIFNAGSKYPTTGGTYGSISLSGNGNITLSRPTTGTYAGVVIFQPADNTKGLSISGNASSVTGEIYAPAAQLSESGNGQMSATIVVDTMTMSGNAIVDAAASNGCGAAVALTPAQTGAASGGSALASSVIGTLSPDASLSPSGATNLVNLTPAAAVTTTSAAAFDTPAATSTGSIAVQGPAQSMGSIADSTSAGVMSAPQVAVTSSSLSTGLAPQPPVSSEPTVAENEPRALEFQAVVSPVDPRSLYADPLIVGSPRRGLVADSVVDDVAASLLLSRGQDEDARAGFPALSPTGVRVALDSTEPSSQQDQNGLSARFAAGLVVFGLASRPWARRSGILNARTRQPGSRPPRTGSLDFTSGNEA